MFLTTFISCSRQWTHTSVWAVTKFVDRGWRRVRKCAHRQRNDADTSMVVRPHHRYAKRGTRSTSGCGTGAVIGVNDWTDALVMTMLTASSKSYTIYIWWLLHVFKKWNEFVVLTMIYNRTIIHYTRFDLTDCRLCRSCLLLHARRIQRLRSN